MVGIEINDEGKPMVSARWKLGRYRGDGLREAAGSPYRPRRASKILDLLGPRAGPVRVFIRRRRLDSIHGPFLDEDEVIIIASPAISPAYLWQRESESMLRHFEIGDSAARDQSHGEKQRQVKKQLGNQVAR